MMGRLSFADAVYLLLMGELPTPAIGRMLNAVLVSSLDHGVTPPSTLAARNVATSGAPLRTAWRPASSRSARITAATSNRACGFSIAASTLMRGGRRSQQAAEQIVERLPRVGHETPPGFGHRFHTRDPRAARLFQMALELELEGEHVRLIRATERALDGAAGALRPPAAGQRRRRDRGDLRRPRLRLRARQRDLPDLAAARAIAHAHEERTRQPPMRQIDPKDHATTARGAAAARDTAIGGVTGEVGGR